MRGGGGGYDNFRGGGGWGGGYGDYRGGGGGDMGGGGWQDMDPRDMGRMYQQVTAMRAFHVRECIVYASARLHVQAARDSTHPPYLSWRTHMHKIDTHTCTDDGNDGEWRRRWRRRLRQRDRAGW